MVNTILVVALLAARVSVGQAFFAPNNLIDGALRDMRSEALRQRVDPASATTFDVYVRGFGGDRDMHARFTHGSIVGLGNLFRLGDCTYGFFGSQMKMGCNVALSNIRFLMNADIQEAGGFNRHLVSTESRVQGNTYALIEIEGSPGQRARLSGITVRSVTLTTDVVQGRLPVIGQSYSEFMRQVNGNLSGQLAWFLNNRCRDVLDTIVRRYVMP